MDEEGLLVLNYEKKNEEKRKENRREITSIFEIFNSTTFQLASRLERPFVRQAATKKETTR